MTAAGTGTRVNIAPDLLDVVPDTCQNDGLSRAIREYGEIIVADVESLLDRAIIVYYGFDDPIMSDE